jgi:hypothetical protein
MPKTDTEPASYPNTYLSAASQSVMQYWNENDTSGITLPTSYWRDVINRRYTACVRWDTTLIDNRWNCLRASLMPNKVTGNSFSLHLNILSIWNTLGSWQLEAVVNTDNNALVDMLIIKGQLLLPSPKIYLDKKWKMKYKSGYISEILLWSGM